MNKYKNKRKGKKENIIVLITQYEKDYLVNHGVKFGENGISKTISSRRPKYYLAETYNNLSLLKKYRKEIIAK